MEPLRIDALGEIVARFSGRDDGIHATEIPGVNCIRLSELNARLPSVYTPCICVIVQGRKRVLLEKEVYEYRPSQYLAVSVDVPVIGEVTEGSRKKPYLCLQIELDRLELAQLLVQTRTPLDRKATVRRGIFVADVDSLLSDCALRLARLLDTPQEIPVLAPMIKREIYYRLLSSPYGQSIAQLAQTGSHTQRIAAAIKQLKADYAKPIRIEALANRVGMSVSSFHAHFKAVTAMSPLQYQKRLRLLEARQIMLGEMRDAVSTAYRVGYESASQFSREYARVFGNPPGRDIKRLMSSGARA